MVIKKKSSLLQSEQKTVYGFYQRGCRKFSGLKERWRLLNSIQPVPIQVDKVFDFVFKVKLNFDSLLCSYNCTIQMSNKFQK